MNCESLPYLGGLCLEHHEKDKAERLLKDAAAKALHYGLVDELPLQEPNLREELVRLRDWWWKACRAVNDKETDPILHDEADAATSWCISLAKEIILAERAFRDKSAYNLATLNYTRHWVWQRFDNLSQGLMSNGIKRPSD